MHTSLGLANFSVLAAENYSVAQALFTRALGWTYVVAFASLAWQVKGLWGKRGILPAAAFLKSYDHILPTLFKFRADDLALQCAAVLGVLLGLCCAFNLFLPSAVTLFLAWAFYYSFVAIGQDFMAFQWDSLLLETGFMAIFLNLTTPPTWPMLLAFWLLLARFMLSSGAVKLRSHDISWRDLSALSYHYFTQPLPNRAAYYVHKLPMWFHKASALAMFFVEFVGPLLVFLPVPCPALAFALFVGLQSMLLLTGNFAFLNMLTLALCLTLIPTPDLPAWLAHSAGQESFAAIGTFLSAAAGMLYIGINLVHLVHLIKPQLFGSRNLATRTWLWLSHFRLTASYGLFAVMTRTRYELIIEGSNDGISWKPYMFHYKPGDQKRAPRQIAPFHPRLDWQMWFQALRPHEPYDDWFDAFLKRLNEGSPDVLKLLAQNPFENAPAKHIRVVSRSYTFTSLAEKRSSGMWWRSSSNPRDQGTHHPKQR
jgi:hypothetical protein